MIIFEGDMTNSISTSSEAEVDLGVVEASVSHDV
jgi:hypothetical protein